LPAASRPRRPILTAATAGGADGAAWRRSNCAGCASVVPPRQATHRLGAAFPGKYSDRKLGYITSNITLHEIKHNLVEVASLRSIISKRRRLQEIRLQKHNVASGPFCGQKCAGSRSPEISLICRSTVRLLRGSRSTGLVGMTAHHKPYIHSRRFPVIRFIENIEQTVTVEICDAGLEKTLSGSG